MEDLCKRTRRLIHKEPRSQYLDTRTYKDIRNISTETNGCDDQTIRIYTDGSKGERGVGAGVVIFVSNELIARHKLN